MTWLGTITYEIEETGNTFRVISKVWNTGMSGPRWHTNFVAECASREEAQNIINKLKP